MVIRPIWLVSVRVGPRAPARRLARLGGHTRPGSMDTNVAGATAKAIGGAGDEVAVHGVSARACASTAERATTARRPRSACVADDAGLPHVVLAAAGNAATARLASCGQGRAAPGGDGGLPARGRRAPVEGPAGGRADNRSAREPTQRGNQTRCNCP